MNDVIHFSLAANHAYLPGLRATLISVINASVDKSAIQVHILSEGLLPEDIKEINALATKCGLVRPIEFRYPDMSVIARNFKPYKGSYAAFLRLFFTELFPELDWMIWSDSDVLWFRDPRELWDLKDDGVSLQWGREPPSGRCRAKKYFEKWHPGYDESRYCCSGILLMNLRRLRDVGITERSVAFVQRWGTPPLVDQDIFNELCYDDARIVDDRWGCYNPDPHWRQGVVLHCSGVSGFFKDLKYDGKWPMWAMWFLYYRQVVEGNPDAKVCSPVVRFLFFVFGLVYIPETVIRILTWPLSIEKADTIRFASYYSWLMRKKLW